MRALVALVVGCGLSSGCWRNAQQIDQAVWSEDDSAQAYVKLLFEERRPIFPMGTTDKKNFRHRVLIQNADGSDRQALTGERFGQNGAQLFYMRRAGFLIVEVIEGRDRVRYDRVQVGGPEHGQTQTIVTWQHPGTPCALFELTPSPDGRYIGTVERLASGGACAPDDVVVDILDASTLAPIARYSWPVVGLVESTWNLAGELIVHDPDSATYKLTAFTGPAATKAPRCVFPKTSSSSVSAQGVMIRPGDNDARPVVVVPSTDPPVFGCQ